MIYLLRRIDANQIDTATAEEEATARRLEKKGYQRCSLIHWRAVRRRNDKRDGRRLALDDWLARQNEPAPDVPPGTAIGELVGGRKIHKGDK